MPFYPSPTSPRDYIFFQVDRVIADSIQGENGLSLVLITGGEPGSDLHHVREYGEVVATPKLLSTHLDTTMDVQIGDKIYFHFHTVSDENRIELEGEIYYKVHYSQVYCAIRDNRLIMLNDYLLATPKMESEDDIKTPGGIYLKMEPEPIPLRAIVAHIPAGPGFDEIQVGDEIYYNSHSDVPISIEGKSYYRMRQQDVLAKYTE